MRSIAALLLLATALFPPAFAQAASAGKQDEKKKIRVAIYDDGGVGGNGADAIEKCLKDAGDVVCEHVKGEDIRKGVLDRFDVLVHPGGSGLAQGKTLADEGRDAVRAFVERGGGYVGVCAGAYLAGTLHKTYLNILDATVSDPEHCNRGKATTVKIKLNAEGKKFLGLKDDEIEIYYHNGPVMVRAEKENIADYTELATFETEANGNGAPEGKMKGRTAMATGTYGKGRVFVSSPHPEATQGRHEFILLAVRWAAGR